MQYTNNIYETMMLHKPPDANTDYENGHNRLYTKSNGIIKCLYIIQSMS